MACVAVAVDTAAAVCRARNAPTRTRARRRADGAASRLARGARTRSTARASTRCSGPSRCGWSPEAFVRSDSRANGSGPNRSGFGSRCTSRRSPAARRPSRPGSVRSPRGRGAGFDAIYTMDHFRQIPQVGRAWETSSRASRTLAWLAACTSRVRLRRARRGRDLPQRRAPRPRSSPPWTCCPAASGVRPRAGWFAAEHRAYGWPFPPVGERYALLGGRARGVAGAVGAGRQSRSGARAATCPTPRRTPVRCRSACRSCSAAEASERTLALAARYADAANVLGDLPTVARKAAVLRDALREAGREVALSHLTTALWRAEPGRARSAGRPASPARRGSGAVGGGGARRHGRRPDRPVSASWPEVGIGRVAVRLLDLVDSRADRAHGAGDRGVPLSGHRDRADATRGAGSRNSPVENGQLAVVNRADSPWGAGLTVWCRLLSGRRRRRWRGGRSRGAEPAADEP
jgi:hypothetical protein